ncbi:hypothetical protein QO003_001742 [Arthrobacter silviterrae]|uniref:hypothetical protein n=1 Tax=Arthrobacter silviterrae TaxID=2026658 RepID=UPI00277D3CCA|nr:hypothetical protein [Arthrobacter silviterrae]MDQ0277439.1 hypothetical protein [Arthrobacter silviterrae]
MTALPAGPERLPEMVRAAAGHLVLCLAPEPARQYRFEYALMGSPQKMEQIVR